MKVLLRFATILGPRTIVAEVGDRETAQATVNAHVAMAEESEVPAASLVEEMPRLSLVAHMKKHKRAMAKAAKEAATPASANVTPMRRKARG